MLRRDVCCCGIGIILAKIGVGNGAIIAAIIRSYTDFFSATDGDEVHPELSID